MSNKQTTIPIIDVGPLFEPDQAARRSIDEAIGETAKTVGGFVATGMPAAYQMDDEIIAKLHTFFTLPQDVRESIAIRSYNPDSNQLWRGYYATLKGGWAHNEFYDIGPETAVSTPDIRGAEILSEQTTWPPEEPTPGWQAAMTHQFQQMHRLSTLVMGALARGLGADETDAMARFKTGYSTLRLLNYPDRPEGVAVGGQPDAVRIHNGVEQPLLTMEHDDSCALSLLWQDPKGGLQMETPDGVWLDVPKVTGGVSIHFGDAAVPLTANMVRATPHRVLGPGNRQSMGFFFEPDLDAPLTPFKGLATDSVNLDEADTYATSLLKVLVERGMYTDMISV
ncbi:MAG: 2OG-Fe(II) oxygenase family protein [Chloroflexota bacterium]